MEEVLKRVDRQIPNTGPFPEDLTPFPEPEPEPDRQHRLPTATTLISPPQKLRPIRSNPRLPSDFINGSDSSQLGFLLFHQDFGDFSGNVSFHANPCQLLNDDMSASELVKIKSEFDANFISNFTSHLSHLHSSLCSSSDDSDDSAPKADKLGLYGKTKRKKRKKLESFVENLMDQVMKKQEQMHQQLMEMIERKERERIMREAAWRKQEMERAKREEDIRAQEVARSLALISFIQNALTPDTDNPQPLSSVLSEEDDGKTQSDGENKRWPTNEVQALITLRTALDHKFNSQGSKASVWEEVSAGMANMGFMRNAKKCKEKWENINKYFKKAMGSGKKPSENSKSCPYFQELEILYKNRLITNTTGRANSPSAEDVQSTL